MTAISGPDQRLPATIFSLQPIPSTKRQPPTKPLTTPRPVGNPSHSTSPPTLTSPPPPLPRTTTRYWGNTTTRHGSKHLQPGPRPDGKKALLQTKKKGTTPRRRKILRVCMHPRLERIETDHGRLYAGRIRPQARQARQALVRETRHMVGVCRPGSGPGWVWSGVTRRAVCARARRLKRGRWGDGQMLALRLRGKGDLVVPPVQYTTFPPPRRTNCFRLRPVFSATY